MSLITQQDLDSLKEFIQIHNSFIIIGHKEPDGDCISSCLGIAAILNHFNKPYQLVSAGPFKRQEIKKYESRFTDKIDFMDTQERNQTGLFITDCSELSRLGDIDFDFNGLDTFIIDHHKTSDLPENAKGYINGQAPAAAFLIQLFYEGLIGPLSKELAQIIFFGICTDTGFFRFLTSSAEAAEVFNAVARLNSYGADPRQTYNDINNGKPWNTRKLLGLLLSTKDVQVAVFLRQDSPTTCTGGFRSLDSVDVSIVASKFGGGGHKNASGMSCEGKIDTLIPSIVKEFARIM